MTDNNIYNITLNIYTAMKKYLSMAACLLMGLSVFTSCSDDDNSDKPHEGLKSVADGVFVLNQGSYFSQINGSLDYYAYGTSSLTPTRNIFKSANGRSLGGTPNDAVINSKGEMYIASTDENRVEIADAKTLKSVAVAKIVKPRAVAYDADAVYVSSYTGKVYKIDATSHELVDSSAVVGTNLEGIAVANGSVYVCNSWNADYTYNKNVVKLNTSLDKLKDITVVTNPTKLIASGNNIFVVSQGNYNDVKPAVQQLNAATDEVMLIGEATMAAVAGDRLYMVNAPYGVKPTYSYYSLSAHTVTNWITGTEIFSPYAIGVDPITNRVYITSLSQNPDVPGSASYTGDGYLVVYDPTGSFMGKYDCGVCPGTIVFAYHFEEVK